MASTSQGKRLVNSEEETDSANLDFRLLACRPVRKISAETPSLWSFVMTAKATNMGTEESLSCIPMKVSHLASMNYKECDTSVEGN